MIMSFAHKGLKEIWLVGDNKKIEKVYHAKISRILAILNAAVSIKDINLPGYRLHKYKCHESTYSIDVNGNYRITFEWKNGNVYNVDYLDPH